MITSSRKLTACIFITIVLVLGVLSLKALSDYGFSRELDPVTGELARDLESHYDEGFPVRDLGTNLWAAINYTVFEEGRPGVTLGKQGWLFTDEEIYPGSESPGIVTDNLQRVSAVAAYLRAEGVPLAILVVPSKARVYAEKLGQKSPAPVMGSLYHRFQKHLASEQIDAPDLLASLTEAKDRGEQVFLRTDTHWTPQGAEVFARHAAGEIKALFPEQSWEQTRFVTALGDTRRHEGDLLTYLPLKPLFPSLGPEPDTLTERSTGPESGADGSAESLFAENTAGLVLVGTSYSANPLWDFPGALKRYLGRDLINVADGGKGPFRPMTEYLRSDEFRNHPPELVVWEFPERYLAQPIKSEQTLAWFERRENLLAQSDDQGRPSIH